MSITRKFMVALALIVFAGLLLTAMTFYVVESRAIQAKATSESERISKESLRLLGVIDVIMAERVKKQHGAVARLWASTGRTPAGRKNPG